jgi:hypothetical protein
LALFSFYSAGTQVFFLYLAADGDQHAATRFVAAAEVVAVGVWSLLVTVGVLRAPSTK